MNILVTGGAGFIGSHTIVELINAGHTPIILDNFCNSDTTVLDGIKQITSVRPKLYVGDCTDQYFVESVFENESIDGVIHFAALKAVGESTVNPLLYYRNNIDSLLTVLERMKTHNVHHIVFSSSATVYGEPDTLPIPETAPIKQASSPYGNTKIICENILQDATATSHDSLKAVSLRYFNPIGAHPSGLIGELPIGIPNNLVPFVAQTAAGIREQLVIFGNDYPTHDGTCIRDYIHVVDLAKAHIKTLEHLTEKQTAPYDVFNVGTGQGTSVKELLNMFERVNNIKVPFVVGPKRNGDIVSCYADPKKIQQTMNWKSEHTIQEALHDAWNWQKTLK